MLLTGGKSDDQDINLRRNTCTIRLGYRSLGFKSLLGSRYNAVSRIRIASFVPFAFQVYLIINFSFLQLLQFDAKAANFSISWEHLRVHVWLC